MISRLFRVLLLIFLSVPAFSQYDYRLFGYITDEETGEPIVGAKVSLPDWQTETYSNNFGYFSISVPSQDFFVHYSFAGFKTRIDSVYIEEDIRSDIKLRRQIIDESLINDVKKSQSDISNPLSGKIDVPTGLLKEFPYLLSEPDLIKGLQSLPGITAGNEFGSNLYVRGGGADQNLILLDGVPVYNGTHIFGLYSIFQPDITNSIQVYKAGFPARYGGRVSSVVDIASKEGNITKATGTASIGLLIARLSVQGPLGKKKNTTYSFGLRRSFWDVFTLTSDSVDMFSVSDYNLKIKHKVTKNDYIHFSIYAGRDRFPSTLADSTVVLKEEVKYGNSSAVFRWNHIFNPKLFSNISVSATRYKVSYELEKTFIDSISQLIASSTWDYKNGISDIAVNAEFEYSMNNNHYFHFGVQNTNHFINPGYSVSSTSDNPGSQKEKGRKYWNYSPEVAVYLEDDIKIKDKLKVNMGLRAVYFSNKTYQYEKIFYEPRFSGRYIVKPDLSLKASYSRMHQTVFLLTNSGIGFPFNFWVPATNAIPAQQSDQVNIGFAKELKKGFQLSVDGYYKITDNILFAKEDPAYIDNDLDWQTILEKGKSTGYGLEMFLQKNSGYLTGWLGYTLAFATRQFDNLNRGRSFEFSYNRRHTINLALNYRITEGNSFFMNLTLATPRYFTIPGGKYLDIDGNIILDYSALNNYRGPFFQRLDLGCIFKKKRTGSRVSQQLFLTLYNALLAKNPISIFADYTANTNNPGQGSYKVLKTSVPFFIPGFTYVLKI